MFLGERKALQGIMDASKVLLEKYTNKMCYLPIYLTKYNSTAVLIISSCFQVKSTLNKFEFILTDYRDTSSMNFHGFQYPWISLHVTQTKKI